jgi:hypothetical protein
MGIKEAHIFSGTSKSTRQSHLATKEPARTFGSLVRILLGDSRLKFELKKLFVTMMAVFCQHFNLFDFNFEDYNFKLIIYIFLVLSMKVNGMIIKAIDFVLPVNSFGLKTVFSVYRTMARLLLVYLFFFMYDFPTPLRLLFLGY